MQKKHLTQWGRNFYIQQWIKFSFHDKFIKGIKTLYTSPIARKKVNRGLSGAIHLQDSCCQRCTASPVLFNLFTERLAQAERQSPEIEGITKYVFMWTMP